MGDRLKVKAYIKSQKRMIENVCSFEYLHHFSANDYKFIKIRFVDNNYETKFDNLGCYIPDEIILPVDDVVIIQCTGLKDKNGKLIYEGDKLKPDEVNSVYEEVVVWDEDDAMFKVRGLYSDEEWNGLYSESVEDYVYEPLRDYTNIEIIGNIYETPELLEVQA